MKLTFKVMIAATVLLVFQAAASRADLRFGVAAEPYAPFTEKDATGTWAGWEIDLMNAVCRHMGETCVVVEASWDGMIPSLNARMFDVIWSSMGITDERKALIDFTDVYYEMPSVLIGAKNGDTDISPDHLRGKTIGLQFGTIYSPYVEKHYGGAAVKIYQTQDEVHQDLTAGRIDYALGDLLPLMTFLETETGASCCELKGQVARDPDILGIGAAGGLRKGDAALRARLNAALKAVFASGEYDAISGKYFTLDIAPR